MSRNGRYVPVKLLLERRDVNLVRLDDSGQTKHLWAARYGGDEVVKLLLEREDVFP